jgi:hypothetical protein
MPKLKIRYDAVAECDLDLTAQLGTSETETFLKNRCSTKLEDAGINQNLPP